MLSLADRPGLHSEAVESGPVGDITLVVGVDFG
jgi:hypothetical protein